MGLNIAQLSKGDLLLKYADGSLISGVISLGQKIVGQANTNIVHAGILCDQVHIVEAQGAGVVINNLLTGNNKYGYKVYRAVNPILGDAAGTCAKIFADIHKTSRNLKYTMSGAAGSLHSIPSSAKTPATMDELMDQILSGKNSPFFCSQFVVYMYQFVAAQNGIAPATLFSLNDAKASPAHLASLLQLSRQFTHIGDLEPSHNGKHQNNNAYLANR